MLGRILGLMFLVVGFSMLGGMLFTHTYSMRPPTDTPEVKARRANVSLIEGISVSAHYPNILQNFYNAQGRLQMDFGVYQNATLMDFYNTQGKGIVQFGTYNDSVRTNEAGLSFAGLSDERGHLRLLVRLDGSDAAPLIILKDSSGRNRMILGLDINGGEYNPFLVRYDSTQNRSVFFGRSSSPGNPFF